MVRFLNHLVTSPRLVMRFALFLLLVYSPPALAPVSGAPSATPLAAADVGVSDADASEAGAFAYRP